MTAQEIVRRVLDSHSGDSSEQAKPAVAAAIVEALREAGLLADDSEPGEQALRPDELNAHNDL